MATPNFQLFTSLRYDPILTSLAKNTESWDGSEQDTESFSPFYIASFHRDRILLAAEHFGWALAAAKIRGHDGFSIFLKTLHEAIDITSPQPLRVRVLLSYSGELTVESNPTLKVGEWNLFPHRIPPPKSAVPKMKVSPLTGGALSVGTGDRVHGDPAMEETWEIIPDTASTTPSPYTTYKTTSRDMYTAARERVRIKDMAEKKEVLIISDREGEIMEGSLTSVFFWREGKWTTPPIASGGQAGTTRRWALEKGFCVEGVVKVEGLVDGEECWISNGVRGFSLGRVKLS